MNWERVWLLATRLGVVACVGIASLVAAGKLDDAVAIFDFRADLYAAATYRERTYPASPWVAGSARVMEDARLWMPEDAAYRVIHGPDYTPAASSGFEHHFLLGLLLPRAQTQSESSRWVFCYGCSQLSLGERYEVLSDSGNGFVFARRRS